MLPNSHLWLVRRCRLIFPSSRSDGTFGSNSIHRFILKHLFQHASVSIVTANSQGLPWRMLYNLSPTVNRLRKNSWLWNWERASTKSALERLLQVGFQEKGLAKTFFLSWYQEPNLFQSAEAFRLKRAFTYVVLRPVWMDPWRVLFFGVVRLVSFAGENTAIRLRVVLAPIPCFGLPITFFLLLNWATSCNPARKKKKEQPCSMRCVRDLAWQTKTRRKKKMLNIRYDTKCGNLVSILI